MDALAVSKHRLIADAAALHHRLVSMTASAGLRDVRAIDRRLWIAGRQNRRHVAIPGMAIKTRRGFDAVLFRLRVEAVVVAVMRVSMKERTRHVGKLFAETVTTLALKCRRTGRQTRVRSADDRTVVRLYRSRC